MKKILFLLNFMMLINVSAQKKHIDKPFIQDYADKYNLAENFKNSNLLYVSSNRDGVISVVSSKTLLHPWDKKLVKDSRYRPFENMNVLANLRYKNQIVYLTDRAVLSNAFAGEFYINHGIKNPTHFAVGNDFETLVVSNNEIVLFKNEKKIWSKSVSGLKPLEVIFDQGADSYYILTKTIVYQLKNAKKFSKIYSGNELTSITVYNNNIILGTGKGFLSLKGKGFKPESLNQKLPCVKITAVNDIDGSLWFGSKNGAFKLRKDGKFDYYASKRWLPDNEVVDVVKGPENSILVLTKKGLSQINFKKITLEEKAEYFQKIQRSRHIRYGQTGDLYLKVPGDVSSGVFKDTDNDGLWTSMYLAGELFRYAVTKSEDAKENAYEAFVAIERLTTISGIKGFPARAFEREGVELDEGSNGFSKEEMEVWLKENGATWQFDKTGRWKWKVSTSSDESCGHFFVNALFAELAPDKEWRDRAVRLIKLQMDHIIENDWHLVTWNGKPTRWGNWNPDYVNGFPINVGDRRLNSTLILAFLQTAYHFTGDELYKKKAYELIDKYGYDENANRPATVIQHVPGEPLSDGWNHSDDEMYFLTIPAFVNYSLTPEQRKKHFDSARSHWEVERSEKNPLWNFMYALTGGKDYDLEDSVWWLQEFPLDLISWSIDNSHRKDLEKLEPNFRGQTYKEVLPPDEVPVLFHNGAYRNNRDGKGMRETAPHVWLLPYWAGRYVKAISEASENK